MSEYTWNNRWLGLANHVAKWSKDKSTKVGTVITTQGNVLVSLGWNGFPRRVEDDKEERHQRPLKYKWTEHAERNAIYNAASMGVSTANCKMYLSWFPCSDCARAIIQSGITEVICNCSDLNLEQWTTWSEDMRIARIMLREAGIKITHQIYESDDKYSDE